MATAVSLPEQPVGFRFLPNQPVGFFFFKGCWWVFLKNVGLPTVTMAGKKGLEPEKASRRREWLWAKQLQTLERQW